MMNSKKYLYVIVCALLIGAALLSGCRKKPSSTTVAEASTAPGQPVEVTTTQAVAREVPQFLQVTGSFSADETSDVASETSGLVTATPVDVGAFVKQGTVIARLDDRDAKLKLQQALASEQQAEAAVKQAEVKIGLGEGGKFEATAVPEVIAARQSY